MRRKGQSEERIDAGGDGMAAGINLNLLGLYSPPLAANVLTELPISYPAACGGVVDSKVNIVFGGGEWKNY